QYGIGMDTSFYWWGPWLKNSSNQWVCTGYMTGSGLPMKFVDPSGNVIPVYQEPTELVDETMIAGAAFGFCGLTQAQALTASQQFVDQTVGGYYAPITIQAHTDYFDTYTSQWLGGLLAYAQSKGLPIWTTTRWLSFTQARHDASISQYNWNATT